MLNNWVYFNWLPCDAHGPCFWSESVTGGKMRNANSENHLLHFQQWIFKNFQLYFLTHLNLSLSFSPPKSLHSVTMFFTAVLIYLVYFPYVMNHIWIPPKFICWDSAPQWDGTWRWGLWISAIIRRACFPPCTLIKTYEKMKKMAFIGNKPCWSPDLASPPSSALRNKLLMLTSLRLWYLLDEPQITGFQSSKLVPHCSSDIEKL